MTLSVDRARTQLHVAEVTAGTFMYVTRSGLTEEAFRGQLRVLQDLAATAEAALYGQGLEAYPPPPSPPATVPRRGGYWRLCYRRPALMAEDHSRPMVGYTAPRWWVWGYTYWVDCHRDLIDVFVEYRGI